MPANTVKKNILFQKLAANSLNIPKSAGDNNATTAFLLARRSACLSFLDCSCKHIKKKFKMKIKYFNSMKIIFILNLSLQDITMLSFGPVHFVCVFALLLFSLHCIITSK